MACRNTKRVGRRIAVLEAVAGEEMLNLYFIFEFIENT